MDVVVKFSGVFPNLLLERNKCTICEYTKEKGLIDRLNATPTLNHRLS